MTPPLHPHELGRQVRRFIRRLVRRWQVALGPMGDDLVYLAKHGRLREEDR